MTCPARVSTTRCTRNGKSNGVVIRVGLLIIHLLYMGTVHTRQGSGSKKMVSKSICVPDTSSLTTGGAVVPPEQVQIATIGGCYLMQQNQVIRKIVDRTHMTNWLDSISCERNNKCF